MYRIFLVVQCPAVWQKRGEGKRLAKQQHRARQKPRKSKAIQTANASLMARRESPAMCARACFARNMTLTRSCFARSAGKPTPTSTVPVAWKPTTTKTFCDAVNNRMLHRCSRGFRHHERCSGEETNKTTRRRIRREFCPWFSFIDTG